MPNSNRCEAEFCLYVKGTWGRRGGPDENRDLNPPASAGRQNSPPPLSQSSLPRINRRYGYYLKSHRYSSLNPYCPTTSRNNSRILSFAATARAPRPRGRGGIKLAFRDLAVALFGRAEISLLFKTVQKRIKRSSADLVTVAAKLFDHAEAKDWFFSSMMENMKTNQP